jgi:hypothetical protein
MSRVAVRRVPVALVVVLFALAAFGSVAGAKSSRASSHQAVAGSRVAPTAATAPFTAPTEVALLDSPPPWPLPSDARPYIVAAHLPILKAEQLTVHYHAHLDIIANGAKVTVPAGVGFVITDGTPTAITPLHTHNPTGIIHIESAKNLPYTLGQVFTEWGVPLSASQVGGLHADADHLFATYVNGKRFTGDPATLRLKRHLEIAIWYGLTGQTPRVPSSFHFPAGY